MSLHISLHVNDKPIGRMVITRQAPLDTGMKPDTVGLYAVMVDGKYIGQLEHRYGDGPWVLTAKAAGLLPPQEGT
jgi:hypothetical protein